MWADECCVVRCLPVMWVGAVAVSSDSVLVDVGCRCVVTDEVRVVVLWMDV